MCKEALGGIKKRSFDRNLSEVPLGLVGPKESDIKREIITFLRYHNVLCWVNVSAGIYDVKQRRFRKLNGIGMRRGVSDVLGIYRGKFLAIEVKVPGNTPTESQKDFITEILWHGGIAFVATSVDDVRRELSL